MYAHSHCARTSGDRRNEKYNLALRDSQNRCSPKRGWLHFKSSLLSLSSLSSLSSLASPESLESRESVPVRDTMFIVGRGQREPKPRRGGMSTLRPDGAWILIGSGCYKHCAPTELTSQKRFQDSPDSPDSLDSIDSVDSVDSIDSPYGSALEISS